MDATQRLPIDATQRLPKDATQRLPPELLLRIFDFFAHGDSPRAFIRGPGRVCARWRRLARAHPSFFKDIWLERDLGPAALGLCKAQLDAGAGLGADVDLTVVHPDEIGPVVRVIEGSLERCASLHVEFYGAPAEVRALFGVLAARPAPRLRRLHLRVEPVVDEDDSADYDGAASEALAFPADIFRGDAPRLTRLELCGAVCMMLPPLDPVPAFSRVESLEVHAYAFGPHAVARALTAAPATRHLEVLAVKHGTGPWPPARLPPSGLQLEKVLFSALDSAWDDLLTALNVYALPEFAVLCGMPARYVAAYARHSLPAPASLELAVCDSTRLGLAHTDAVLSAPSLNRSLRLVDSLSTGRLAPYADRIVRLEVPTGSADWPAVTLPQLKMLVLHVMADRLRPVCAARCRVRCLRLREMALLLGKRAPPEAFRVKADHVAYFVRDRLGLDAAAGLLEVSVARPLVLVGRRLWLAATVAEVSEV